MTKILTPINPASDLFEAQAVCDEHRSVPLELVGFPKAKLPVAAGQCVDSRTLPKSGLPLNSIRSDK